MHKICAALKASKYAEAKARSGRKLFQKPMQPWFVEHNQQHGR
jgi:hypothetical protein